LFSGLSRKALWCLICT